MATSAWNIVVVCKLYLLTTVLVLTAARSSVKWDRQHVELKQGDSLQVTCTASGLSRYSVVRVEKRNETSGTSMIITENGDAKHPFSRLSRYNVRFEVIDDIGTVSIYYRGIRGEDDGTLVCYKLADSNNEEKKARLQLKVLVPIQSVQLFSVSADKRETLVDSHTVTLTETSLTDVDVAGTPERRGVSGVVCVAAVNGSLSPPDVRIMMDDGDVTSMFVPNVRSNILEDPELRNSYGGLGMYYGERKMSYVTAMPETSWNGQLLTCVAAQNGFPDESVFAMVVVRYIPQIACESHDMPAEMGDPVTLSCNVHASPSATVDWFFGEGNETLDNSTDVDSWTVANKRLANDEGVHSTLHIAKLVPARLGSYRINARNAVGVSEEKVEVRRRSTSDGRHDSSVISGSGHPGYSHSHGNGDTGKI